VESAGWSGCSWEFPQPSGAAMLEEGTRRVRVPRLSRPDKDAVGGSGPR
jgi:hypothetical protein